MRVAIVQANPHDVADEPWSPQDDINEEASTANCREHDYANEPQQADAAYRAYRPNNFPPTLSPAKFPEDVRYRLPTREDQYSPTPQVQHLPEDSTRRPRRLSDVASQSESRNSKKRSRMVYDTQDARGYGQWDSRMPVHGAPRGYSDGSGRTTPSSGSASSEASPRSRTAPAPGPDPKRPCFNREQYPAFDERGDRRGFEPPPVQFENSHYRPRTHEYPATQPPTQSSTRRSTSHTQAPPPSRQAAEQRVRRDTQPPEQTQVFVQRGNGIQGVWKLSKEKDQPPAPPPMTEGKSLAELLGLAPGAQISLESLLDPEPGARPEYSLSTLIKIAIYTSPRQALTLQEIYEKIMERFEFYRNPANTSWKSSIRHTLSLQAIFQSRPKPITDPGKGQYWYLDFSKGDGNKRPRKRGGKNQTGPSSRDEDEDVVCETDDEQYQYASGNVTRYHQHIPVRPQTVSPYAMAGHNMNPAYQDPSIDPYLHAQSELQRRAMAEATRTRGSSRGGSNVSSPSPSSASSYGEPFPLATPPDMHMHNLHVSDHHQMHVDNPSMPATINPALLTNNRSHSGHGGDGSGSKRLPPCSALDGRDDRTLPPLNSLPRFGQPAFPAPHGMPPTGGAGPGFASFANQGRSLAERGVAPSAISPGHFANANGDVNTRNQPVPQARPKPGVEIINKGLPTARRVASGSSSSSRQR